MEDTLSTASGGLLRFLGTHLSALVVCVCVCVCVCLSLYLCVCVCVFVCIGSNLSTVLSDCSDGPVAGMEKGDV